MLDADALGSRTVAPDVAAAAPGSQRSESLTFGSTNWTTSVVGTTPSWLPVRARAISTGRFLTPADLSAHAAVVVLGATTAGELFGARPAVGQTIQVSGVPMQVVGILATSGSATAQNEDDQAVIPITTAQTRIFGGAARTSVQSIYLEATSRHTLSAAYQEATSELLALHRISNAASADFTITSQQSVLAAATSVDHALTDLLAGIAAISLLVGGIGVMNIMLVSVTERVREIGLRKAVGAPPRIIRRQFLVEASTLGLVGGVVGAALGLIGAVVLPHLISQRISVSPTATVGSIVVAIGIGLLFGVYPASRAASLPPIDALRAE
jgi:putative ABC transport system permease protein